MDEQRVGASSDAAGGGPRDADDTATETAERESAAAAEPSGDGAGSAGIAAPPESAAPSLPAESPPSDAAAAEPAGSDPAAGETAPVGARRRWPKIAVIATAVGAGVLTATACAALFLLGDGPATLGGVAAHLPTGQEQQQEPPADGSWGRVGDPVSSGTFEFTVTGVRTGLERVGGPVQGARAEGRFAVASVTVRNVGKGATMFTDADQLLVDAAGARHRPDNLAGLRAGNSDRLFRRLAPGKQVRGGLVFDLPKGAEPAELRLKDFTSDDDPAVVRLDAWESASVG